MQTWNTSIEDNVSRPVEQEWNRVLGIASRKCNRYCWCFKHLAAAIQLNRMFYPDVTVIILV